MFLAEIKGLDGHRFISQKVMFFRGFWLKKTRNPHFEKSCKREIMQVCIMKKH